MEPVGSDAPVLRFSCPRALCLLHWPPRQLHWLPAPQSLCSWVWEGFLVPFLPGSSGFPRGCRPLPWSWVSRLGYQLGQTLSLPRFTAPSPTTPRPSSCPGQALRGHPGGRVRKGVSASLLASLRGQPRRACRGLCAALTVSLGKPWMPAPGVVGGGEHVARKGLPH